MSLLARIRRWFEPKNHLAGGIMLTKRQFDAGVRAAKEKNQYLHVFNALKRAGVPVRRAGEYPANQAAAALVKVVP